MPSRYKLLTPETDEVRSRQLTIFVTEEKWRQIDRKARRLKTSKSEVCRYVLNAGMDALKMGRARASVDTYAKHRDAKQARPVRVGSAVPEGQTPEPGSKGPDNG